MYCLWWVLLLLTLQYFWDLRQFPITFGTIKWSIVASILFWCFCFYVGQITKKISVKNKQSAPVLWILCIIGCVQYKVGSKESQMGQCDCSTVKTKTKTVLMLEVIFFFECISLVFASCQKESNLLVNHDNELLSFKLPVILRNKHHFSSQNLICFQYIGGTFLSSSSLKSSNK